MELDRQEKPVETSDSGPWLEISLTPGECGYFGQIRLRVCLESVENEKTPVAVLRLAWHAYTDEWMRALREGKSNPPLGPVEEEQVYRVRQGEQITVHNSSQVLIVSQVNAEEKSVKLRTRP